MHLRRDSDFSIIVLVIDLAWMVVYNKYKEKRSLEETFHKFSRIKYYWTHDYLKSELHLGACSIHKGI